jgi:hypothetical protein
VEVLFSRAGWVTFDPTPPASGAAAQGAAAGLLGQALDTLRMRWFRYVVEYDLSKQVSFLSEAARLFRSPQGSRAFLDRVKRPAAILAGLLLGAGGLVLLGRRLRRRWRRGSGARGEEARPHSPATALYTRLLRFMARVGHAKPAGATPVEFADALAVRGLLAAPAVRTFTDAYYGARFGGEAVTGEKIDRLGRLVETIEGQVRADLAREKQERASVRKRDRKGVKT